MLNTVRLRLSHTGCCARIGIGQATAAPPARAMNWRRFTRSRSEMDIADLKNHVAHGAPTRRRELPGRDLPQRTVSGRVMTESMIAKILNGIPSP